MEEKIKKMYRGDCNLIIAFTIFLWIVLISTMIVVSSLAPSHTVRIIALGAAIIAGVTATTALLAVLGHLKKNQTQLYSEDIMCSGAMEKQQ
ncbi:hypothetical protein [Candidatus Formimonas warabiya]|uniref:Uncharacterized protein n=1 Tax=Formimonas warabiya TaxID=1761012 RepID=A0A3G1KXU8_FORW1|nr:hypothetical protein [Candidatus Formimonas warabiya]ATW27308.1 hypothetical protein DCMF_23420 [Candidatus Formimonas warabiya]